MSDGKKERDAMALCVMWGPGVFESTAWLPQSLNFFPQQQ